MAIKYRENLKYIFIFVIALLLRLVNLNQSFWLDEAAQVIESSRPFFDQFNLISDFHPPLYHVILHFWMYFGNSEIWVRSLSVIFSIGSILLIYQIGKILTTNKTAILASLFLSISPYHLWYSQEARPYMAFVFFSLLATYFLIRKNWFLYFIAVVLSLYIHYFTFFLIISHIIYSLLLIRKKITFFSLSLLGALTVFSLWIGELLQQLKIGTNGLFAGWQEVVSVSALKTVGLTFAKFILGRGTIENNFIYAIVIAPVFLIFIFSLIRIWKDKSGKILILLFFVPFAASEIITLFVPINAPQRLIFLLPIFFLILSTGIRKLSRVLQWVAIMMVVITSFGGIYQYYTDPGVQREQWREAVSFTENGITAQSAALFVFPGPFAPFTWYTKGRIDALAIAPKFVLTDNDLTNLSAKLVGKKRLFLYQYLTGLTDPQDKVKIFLSNSGFTQTDIKNYPGVGFIYIYDR